MSTYKQFPPMGWCSHCATIGAEAFERQSMALANAVTCLDHWGWEYATKQDNVSSYNLLLAFDYARETFKTVTGTELPLQ